MNDFLILDDDKNSGNESSGENIKQNIDSSSFMDKLNAFVISLQSVKIKEKVVFYNLLSTMTNAGITLLKAVAVLEKQEKNPILKDILGRFGEELKEGKNLSECLSLFPSSFTEAEVGIIQSGEKTGQLNQVLSDLALQLEKVESMSGKIKSAMMYPFFIVLVVIGVVSVMMTMVVPKLLDIFIDKSSLPASTKALIFFSDLFRHYSLFLIIILLIVYIIFLVWKKTPDGKYIFDNFILHIPIFGIINRKMVLSRFARVFAGLVGSGVSIVEALKITSSAVGNEVYKQRLLLLSEDVSSGIKIWESLDGDELFPDMVVEMIQVGEQTAKLEFIILKVADFYDNEVENTITVLNKLLEPVIIVTLAVIVGFIAIAIMQPIMNLADTVAAG